MSALFAATSMIQKSVILTAASPQAPNSRTSRTIGFARFAARPKICSKRPRTFFLLQVFSISGTTLSGRFAVSAWLKCQLFSNRCYDSAEPDLARIDT